MEDHTPEIRFDTDLEDILTYVVIGTRYLDKWVFVRHKLRRTWEIPGGHIEEDETPLEAAQRELQEETGPGFSNSTRSVILGFEKWSSNLRKALLR